MKPQEYLSQQRARFLDDLKGWLAIPSISALPAHKPDMQRAADHLVGMLKRAGIDRAEVRPSDFNPVVYAEHLHAPGKPTILVYGHYDVMPVDPLNEWASKPFAAEVRDNFLYGRGSADDKGQIAIVTNAVEALIKTGTPPCNFKFIVEGGEEVGSEGLDKYLAQHQQELACDAVLVSDTGMAGIDKPSLCVGLRGLCYVEVFFNGPATDLHSGSFGGIVENPAIALAHLISQLKDRSGKVLIPGFYDDVRSLTPADRAAIQAAAKTDADLLKSTGAPKLCGEPGFTPTERIWARPTLDVNGIYGGFTGEGAKTVIPAQAAAKISMRLVADQSPDKISELFEKFVNQIAPDTVKVRVSRLHGGFPYLARTDGPAIAAGKQALKEAFGSEPLLEREGGSIPIVVTLAQALKVDVVLMGFGYPDEHSHAPNEHLPLSHFDKGMVAAARFFELAGASLKAR